MLCNAATAAMREGEEMKRKEKKGNWGGGGRDAA